MDLKLLLISCFISLGWCGLIVPQELTSLLHVAYSNIPPIKKGTDTRVGFGYAFGNHGDMQVMFELGPQLYTKKLAGGGSEDYQRKRQAPALPVKFNKKRDKIQPIQSPASIYLKNWALKMKSSKPKM